MDWRPLFVLMFVAPALAGCAEGPPRAFTELHDACGPRPETDADHSLEVIDYVITSDGAFTVRVPVLLSPDGASVAAWAGSASGTAHVRAVSTPRGDALEISAEDGRRVIVCSLLDASSRGNGCCAERYLDGQWSTVAGQTRPEAVDVQVVTGHVDLSISYVAVSNWCGRDATFSGRELAPGWHSIGGEDGAWCE